jgi:hypothetical protein
MSSPVKLYQQEMHNNLGFFATWLPSTAIALGDIGVLEGGRFRRVASLKELGIGQPDVREGTAENVSYSASAKRSDNISVGAGTAVPLASGELSITFTNEGGYVFEAIKMRQMEVADRLTLASSLLKVNEEGRWQKEWLLIDALYRAESATILVSEDTSSEIVLKASAGALPSGLLPLADPKLGLGIASASGKIVHIVAANNLYPLYSCVKVRDPLLFGRPRVVPVRGRADQHANALGRPGIDELLNS